MLALNNLPLLIFGMLGFIRIIKSSAMNKSVENLVGLSLGLWFLFSFILAGLRNGGYPHYVLTVIPPLAVMASIEISGLYEKWKGNSPEIKARLNMGLCIGSILLIFIATNLVLYQAYVPYKLGSISYEEFSKRILSFSIEDVQPVATYIDLHTLPGDNIYVWSNSMQLYYFADRNPPVDILWPSYVSATGSPERVFNENTKYFAIAKDIKSFPRPQWLTAGLNQYYTLETTIDKYELYRRVEP